MKVNLKLLNVLICAVFLVSCKSQKPSQKLSSLLSNPNAAELNRKAPDLFSVRLETSKGDIVIEVHRDWSPHGADRFYNLVQVGYYDDACFFRIRAGTWAQFGVNGDPKISNAWCNQTIPDDPRVVSNTRGTVAFAFAVPNGRTTQVFINLRDNSATHDAEPFVPFGLIVQGMDVADSLNSEYGESSGGGIRGGKQAPLFEIGNAWLRQNFPRLDYITRATVIPPLSPKNALKLPLPGTGEFRLAFHDP
jgi:cyclophilin family peptidyl-prolyl cis-trans isomerase